MVVLNMIRTKMVQNRATVGNFLLIAIHILLTIQIVSMFDTSDQGVTKETGLNMEVTTDPYEDSMESTTPGGSDKSFFGDLMDTFGVKLRKKRQLSLEHFKNATITVDTNSEVPFLDWL